MSDFSTAYQVVCSPGRDAAAAVAHGLGGLPALVVYLDPVTMSIRSDPSPAATRALAAFCRELAQEATKLADEIDPGAQSDMPDRGTQ